MISNGFSSRLNPTQLIHLRAPTSLLCLVWQLLQIQYAAFARQAPRQALLGTPQLLPETLEGGDPLGKYVVQGGRHGLFRNWRAASWPAEEKTILVRVSP